MFIARKIKEDNIYIPSYINHRQHVHRTNRSYKFKLIRSMTAPYTERCTSCSIYNRPPIRGGAGHL